MREVRVLQFVCPTGMYGAERWILALYRNLNPEAVRTEIAIPLEDGRQQEVIDQFENAGCRVNVIASRSRFSIGLVRKLCKIVRDRKIDIIHTHGYKSDIVGFIVARICDITALSTPHGFGMPQGLKHKIYIRLGKWCLRFFQAVAPLSRQLESELLASGVRRKRIVYIRNAVDINEIDSYRAAYETVAGEHGIKIGYIGQLIPRKNIHHMLDVFDCLWAENHKLRLEIVGDGPSRKHLQAYANSLISGSAISFLGFRNDRFSFLIEFSLFWMTSSDEGIPRCLMEAIAMGVPVAAYRIQGIDQLVIHEETGMLAEYGDKEGLKRYSEQLLYDSEKAEAMARRGKEFLVKKFSGKRMADEYTSLFHKLVSSDE